MFEKAADKILSHPQIKKWYSKKVRMQLKFLYPMREEKEACRVFYKEKLILTMKILFIGTFLAVGLMCSEKKEPLLREGKFMHRGTEASERQSVILCAKVEEDGFLDYEFSYEVEEQKYTQSEIEQKIQRFKEECETLIRGQNESLEQVKVSLILKESYDGYPMSFSWQSDNYALIDGEGNVYNEDLAEKKHVVLTACMTYEETEYEYSFPVCVRPKELSQEKKWEKAVLQAVKEADEEQKYADVLMLPETVDGTKITYSEVKEQTTWYYLLLPAVSAVLVFFAKDKDLKNLSDRRKRQMELKYSEFVSKFQLLLGAGMSVRGVFFKLSEDRSLGQELGQELQLLVRDMKNGIAAKDALDRFGKRSQNPLYMKFSALLIQNMKKGTKDILPMLENESAEAFLLRKNHAKQLGEEAGTKLLGPMMMQLLIVMAVIIVPAFLSFEL